MPQRADINQQQNGEIMATYRTLIGHQNEDGVVLTASQRVTEDKVLAEELAEHWFNRMLGREHAQVGTLSYIAVQKYDDDLKTWDTFSEFEF
jgi:hypothetical protein